MKRRTDILTHLLLLLLVLVACTADDAIKENLSHQDEYVTVRMHIPGMKAVATRAAEADNITSIVALVFRNDSLKSVTEYTTANSTLHPISPISGTITIDKPNNGDVIHFLANLPANYSEGVPYVDYLKGFITNQNKTQEDVLRNLSSRDYDKLSYWGMATRNENNAVMDVMLYRNKAMIEIKPGENCTFRQDELFIAGLDNPNNVGLLVPYNGGFNFDLDNNDYLTLPQDPEPLDTTVELTNYGAGYDNAYYVFEHENPNDTAKVTAKGLYVICKIGDDYYKVALHDEKGKPYPIIRNHKYTILVNDLDAGCETYSEALSADPIKPTVIETKDVTFIYTDNATVYLNGGASSTLPVGVTIPAGASLTQFSIVTNKNFDVTTTDGTLTETDDGYTYQGGSTTFTFIPKNAGDYTIQISGSGNNLNDFSRSINVKVDATVMSVEAKNGDSEINMDNSEISATLVLTRPGNVSNVKVSVSSDVFEYSVNGNEYTFTPKNNNIASGSYTVTFSDSIYPDKVKCSDTITVVNTPNVVSEMSATPGTIDIGQGQTFTIITLTKPTDIQNVKVTFNSEVFIINDNQYTSDDYWINNNSNETIDIKFTLRNNNVNSGEYQITFANGDESITGSTTITIISTPSLKYSYTNTTLYMDSNPQLPVTITVPNGSTLTQLIISATGFTIKDANGNPLGKDNYTDDTTRQSGDSVTYKFIPNSTDADTITFSGSGTNIVVPEETISVTVEPTKPTMTEVVLWGNKEGEGNTSVTWGGFSLSNEVIKDYAGKTILIDIVTDNDDDYKQLRFKVGETEFSAIEGHEELPRNVEKTIEVTLPNDLTAGFIITGDGVVFKKFYYVPNY